VTGSATVTIQCDCGATLLSEEGTASVQCDCGACYAVTITRLTTRKA